MHLCTKYDIKVLKISIENAGENLLLEHEYADQGINITWKYTAPGMLQHNDQVEKKNAIFYNKVRMMIVLAGYN